MDWRNEAAGDLPRPSPREPRTLRQDLLDEVQDHLLLAAEAERTANEDATDDEIRTSVIERFGNPAAVVRRLWWDAMKEVVMRDRIIAGAAVVTAVACVLFVVGVWMQMSNRQDALLTAIQELKQEEARPEYETTLVVHRGSLDGPPAEGVEVSVSHKPAEGDAIGIDDTTGPDGSVTFKFQNEGNYDLTLVDPASSMTLNKQLTIFAGHGEGEQHIAAPDIGTAELRLRTPLPPEISDEEALLLVELGCEMSVEGRIWRFEDSVLVGHGGMTQTTSSDLRGETSELRQRAGTVDRRMAFVFDNRPSHPVSVRYRQPVGPALEALKVPALPVSVRAIRPALTVLTEPWEGICAVAWSPHAYTEYVNGTCLVNPGEGPQLVALPESTLTVLLGAVQSQRVMRMLNDGYWNSVIRSFAEDLVAYAQIREADVVGKTEGGFQTRPATSGEWTPAPDDLAQDLVALLSSEGQRAYGPDGTAKTLASFAENGEMLVITVPEEIKASEDGNPLEILFLYSNRDAKEVPETPDAGVFLLHEKQLIQNYKTSLKWDPDSKRGLLRIALPQEHQRVEAGTRFLIVLPGTDINVSGVAPLLAEFEEPDMTLAEEAMALCPEGE